MTAKLIAYDWIQPLGAGTKGEWRRVESKDRVVHLVRKGRWLSDGLFVYDPKSGERKGRRGLYWRMLDLSTLTS